MWDMFPLPAVQFDTLQSDVQDHLTSRFGKEYCTGAAFRLLQATTPMVFKWSVVLAHVAMTQANDRAFAAMRKSHT